MNTFERMHTSVSSKNVVVMHLSLAKFKSLIDWLGRLANHVCRNPGMIIHFNVISKTNIAVFLCESTRSCMLVCQPAQLAC